MRALDVMTSNVITVGSSATVQDVATLMLEHGISAVPVVDGNGLMVGIVSEGDLLRRTEIGTEHQRSWWLEFISSNRNLAADYVKSNSRRVTDVMSTNLITVDENAPIGEIADLLESRNIKRVPVLRSGKPVGIVSRANLIRALATAVNARRIDTESADQAIQAQLLAKLRNQKWSGANQSNVVVQDGVVHLCGFVLSEEERRALRVAAENVPGVKAVEDHLRESTIAPFP